jgi:hypothetical protein
MKSPRQQIRGTSTKRPHHVKKQKRTLDGMTCGLFVAANLADLDPSHSSNPFRSLVPSDICVRNHTLKISSSFLLLLFFAVPASSSHRTFSFPQTSGVTPSSCPTYNPPLRIRGGASEKGPTQSRSGMTWIITHDVEVCFLLKCKKKKGADYAKADLFSVQTGNPWLCNTAQQRVVVRKSGNPYHNLMVLMNPCHFTEVQSKNKSTHIREVNWFISSLLSRLNGAAYCSSD